MAYKAPPAELTKHVSRLLKGKLLKKPPTWLSAVKAVPPGPSIIRSQNPEVNITGQSTAEQQFIQANRPTVHTSIRHKQKNLKTKAPKPRQIVYPEDRLRRQFYKDHPFELQRPKLLVETTEGINRTDFSQLLLPGMHPAQVDGEA
jgi:small subunit ribosomal protein S23